MLIAQPITAEAFTPYGTLIEWPGSNGGTRTRPDSARPINGGTSQRIDWPAALSLTQKGGEPRLALFQAQARAFPFTATELEVHRHGSQSFAPLGLTAGELAYVALVATALPDGQPNLDTLHAFACSGAQAISLAPGTWHHALLAVRAASFLVVERHADPVDCDTLTLAQALRVQLAPSARPENG